MKVHIRTYGCQMNERDSENIAAEFIQRGCEICQNDSEADIIVVNTCSVREQAEQKAIGKIGHVIKSRNSRHALLPVVGVTGCMAQNRGTKLLYTLPTIDFIAGARQTHRVADMAIEMYNRRISGIAHPQVPKEMRRSPAASDSLIDISDNLDSHRFIDKHLPAASSPCAYVSIMQGCQMNCSYCIVPKTRGIQRSRPLDEVVAEVEKLAKSGTREVTLLGQVVNAFGRELPAKNGKSGFVELLEKIAEIEGIQRIRFTSPHPSFFRDDLISCYANLPQLCHYVHLPMQSGNDRILKEMKRPYRAEQFYEIVKKLRAAAPDISISTDVIVGFPTESDEEFQGTKNLFEKCQFDMAYIFKYSPRKGTLSALQADDVSEETKELRNQSLLASLQIQSQKFNDLLIGTIQPVLVESAAKRGNGFFMGRTPHHRKAIFKASPDCIGKFVNVKISSASVSTLGGDIVD